MGWPLENPTRVALLSTLSVFLVGTAVILATGATLAYFGTLVLGCVALGTILATALDRSGAQAAKR